MRVCGLEVRLCALSSMEVLVCTKAAEQLEAQLMKEDFDGELTRLLCENGALAWMAVVAENGEKVFASPRDALERMSLTELAEVYEEYQRQFLDGEDMEECAMNETFEEVCNGSVSGGA